MQLLYHRYIKKSNYFKQIYKIVIFFAKRLVLAVIFQKGVCEKTKNTKADRINGIYKIKKKLLYRLLQRYRRCAAMKKACLPRLRSVSCGFHGFMERNNTATRESRGFCCKNDRIIVDRIIV